MEEEFKLLNYRGANIYVSKNGRVIFNNRELSIHYNKDGYPVCSITTPKNGCVTARIARLVALAYIPNPNNLPEVNHKDYNRSNSNVENLEWMSHADNVRYSNCNRPNYNGKNNPNYGNHKLSEIYANNKNYAIEKQSRKGLQNGRCRKIKMYKYNKLVAEFDYIVDCMKYIKENISPQVKQIESIRSQIDKSIRNNKSYKGYTFVKE